LCTYVFFFTSIHAHLFEARGMISGEDMLGMKDDVTIITLFHIYFPFACRAGGVLRETQRMDFWLSFVEQLELERLRIFTCMIDYGEEPRHVEASSSL
jgi:hypothetical protein